MGRTRKITANIPADILEDAQRVTGNGVTKTLVEGLKALDRNARPSAMRRLRGKVTFDLDLGLGRGSCLWTPDRGRFVNRDRGQSPWSLPKVRASITAMPGGPRGSADGTLARGQGYRSTLRAWPS